MKNAGITREKMKKHDSKEKTDNWLMTILERPEVKSVLLGFLTVLIGILSAFLEKPNFEERNTWIMLAVVVILVIVYIALLWHYSKKEVEEAKKNQQTRLQNEMYKEILIGSSSICKLTARGVNTVIHSIAQDGVYETKSWSFDASCVQVCDKVYDLLKKISPDVNDRYSVCYVRRDESDGIGNRIYVNAYRNKEFQPPTVYRKFRDINESNEYLDAKLFKENKADVFILIGKDVINRTFAFRSNDVRNKHANKYNQYVGVPVVCETSNGGKMVGLLEIVCLDNTEIAPTSDEIQAYITKYIVPYTSLLLVMHKMEKALMAKPEDKDEKDVKIYEPKKTK